MFNTRHPSAFALALALLGWPLAVSPADEPAGLPPGICPGPRILELPPNPLDPSRPPSATPVGEDGLADPIYPLPQNGPPTPGAGPLKVDTKGQSDLGTLTGKVTVQGADAWREPAVQGNWQAEQAWRLSLLGPISVFGQVGGNSAEAAQRDMKVTGRTGLACTVPLWPRAEFAVRGGPGVSYTDPLRPERTLGQSDWQVEVQARCPLVFGVGLEYQGTATPALTPQDHDRINQDLHLAFPVGSSGKLQLGAKRQWQSNTDPHSADSTQLYLGLQLTR
jgi:hypothetical protein